MGLVCTEQENLQKVVAPTTNKFRLNLMLIRFNVTTFINMNTESHKLAESYREVAGIPRIAPLKSPEKNEKQIPAETEPIESQATDNQPDKQ